MTTLVKTPLVFTDKDYNFIKAEFGLAREEVDRLDAIGIEDLYEKCCEVEIAEAPTGDDHISPRGADAVHLVDLIHGPYDSTEFDAEMAEDE
jgi:hypothetical protein